MQVDWLGVFFIAAFQHICMQIPNLHDSKMLDCFMQGLKLSLFECIMDQASKIFEDANHLAERASMEK